MDDLRTALDDPDAGFSEYERNLIEQIREHGWRSTHVTADQGKSPSFTYSTGFWLTHRHPEIIVFDFPADLAHDVLGTIFRKFRAVGFFPAGEPVAGILAEEFVFLVPLRDAAIPEYLISSHWFYKGDRFPSLQLVWADRSGRFPWQEGFESRLLTLQPDLSKRGWSSDLC